MIISVFDRVENIVGKGEAYNYRCLVDHHSPRNFESFYTLNSLPNDNILDLSKFRAFAENKSNVTQNLKIVLGRVENIVGIGENAGYQHFLLFLQCFQKLSFSGLLKVGIVW